MATKYQRGSVWYLNWRDAKGKRYRAPLGKISEEQAELARKAKEVELGTGVNPLGIGISAKKAPLFADFAVEYFTWYEREYPSSADRAVTILDHLVPFFKGDRLDEIKSKRVQDYKHLRASEPIQQKGRKSTKSAPPVPTRPTPEKLTSAATIIKEFNFLKAMLERAVEWEYIDKHPFKGKVEAPKNLRSKAPGFYTKEQLIRLYAASKPPRKGEFDYAPVWQFMANTGLRRTEAVKARRKDIVNGRKLARDLPDRDFILVESEPEGIGAGRTKSGKMRRVPLNEPARQALSLLGKDRLLPPVDVNSLGRAFMTCAKRAGLRGSLHWLRHTFGTNLLLAGVSLKVVQELMGHESITTTEQYLHVLPEHVALSVDQIDL